MAETRNIDQNARLSVAPMMDWTDRHCRYFHRLLSKETLLYTEMVTAPALVRGGATHLLEFSSEEQPVALQLGGSDPTELAEAARIGEARGYVEINLNCGCPSDRVQSGTFGAVLMKTPEIVADAVRAMGAAVAVPLTVKCRIGVDEQVAAEVLPEFLARVQDAGCNRVIVHARKAWLQGLSPKESREVPPLDYPLVRAMKERFPDLHLSINGGVDSLAQAEDHLADGLDGVMVGRAAYHQPYAILAEADRRIFGRDCAAAAPEDVAREMIPYVEAHVAAGGRAHQVTRHMLGLFAGQPGARSWRRVLSEAGARRCAGAEIIEEALSARAERRAA